MNIPLDSRTPEFDQALKTLSPARQLKMARTASGFSRDRLSKAMGTSNSRICFLEESPGANPTHSTISRAAQEMGLHAVTMLVPAHEVIPMAESFLERRKQRAKALLEERVAMNILLEND